jgi:benzoate membrane transport protein
MAIFEAIARPVPGIGRMIGDYRGFNLATGVVSFLFACTGPVAIIISIGLQHPDKVPEGAIESWIFAGLGLSGVVTIVCSMLYRIPLAYGWTIPGSVLVLAALNNMSYAEMVGACIVTGLLILLLGVTGLVKRVMEAVPLPLVMAMVAGIFLRFGLDIVRAFTVDGVFWIALAAVGAYILSSFWKAVGRFFPPVFAALIAGTVAALATGQFNLQSELEFAVVEPILIEPAFSVSAIVELVIPMAIAVLVLQNAQGIAVLSNVGHKPPINTITNVCGIGSVVYAVLGSVNTCLTGPVNAIVASSGPLEKHYLGAVTWGAFAILFGLFAPVATTLALAFPAAFILMLGGLAMLRVLESSFVAAFKGRYTLGALVVFLVTVADVSIFSIGAPFWGLVFGVATSLLLEQDHFRAERAERESTAQEAKAQAEAGKDED